MKKVIVTGAAGGMGNETVKYLSSLGYFVYALDLKKIEEINNVKSFQVDLTKKEELDSVYNEISKDGMIDGIISLSGMYYMDSFIEIEEEVLRKVIDVNFLSVYLVNKVFMPLLNKGSKIIITTSEVAPLDPLPFNAIYSVSKSLLESYTIALRQELNLKGIKVIELMPGAVSTGMINDSIRNIDRVNKTTKLYKDEAKRFLKVVQKNESKTVLPIKIAKLVGKIMEARKPRLMYRININRKLRLLNVLPRRWQVAIITKILKG